MAANDARTVNQFRRLTAPDDDALLLERFSAHTDAAAFSELVRRHGPMVLGVCRRVLGPGPDAEDAFQGAFLVLARKAGSVRNGRSVASWLFGVARFVALRARDKDRRRREHEARAARVPRTEADPELLAAVDEELHRLPDRYRVPLIVCFLQNRTQEDAAKELRCSLSTLRRRLEQGQEVLRRRLAGRGIGAGLGTLAVGACGANVSAAVVETVTALAVVFINDEARAVPATALAEGVLATMARTKWKELVTAALVMFGLVGGGIAWQLAAAPQPVPVGEVGQRPAPVGIDPPAKEKGAKPIDPAAKDKDAKGITPATGDKIKPGDRLLIRGFDDFDQDPIFGVYEVEPSGKVPLSPRYGGRVKIDGLTLEEAEVVVRKQVRESARRGDVLITRAGPADAGALELRLRLLEKELKDCQREVKELRSLVEDLRKPKP